MNNDDLIAYAFELGCGVNIKEIQETPLFQGRIRRARRLYEDFPGNTPLGQILRLGLHQASQRIQQPLESDSLSVHPAERVRQSRSRLAKQVLLRELGSSIIRSARNCLPDVLFVAEDVWPHVCLEEQGNLIDGFYEIVSFVKRHHARGRVSNQRSRTLKGSQSKSKRYLPEHALPLQYGKYGVSPIAPNCLGMAQMLVAFAKMTGAPVMLASMLNHPNDIGWKSETLVCQTLLRDIKRHHLQANHFLVEGLKQNISIRGMLYLPDNDYHHAIVVRQEDGNWMYVDPYCNMIGILTDEVWQLNQIYARLNEFEPVAPGLTLIGHDHGSLRNTLKEARRRVHSLLTASRLFTISYYATFEEMPKDLDAFIAFCLEQEVVQAHFADPKAGAHTPKALLELILGSLVEAEDIKTGKVKDRFASDDGLRYYFINAVQSEFHRIAKRLYRNESIDMRTDCLMAPPAIEFSLPEVNLALLTLNHLQRWADGFENLPGEWMLEHSSSQILWQQSMQRRYKRTKRELALLRDAEQLVRFEQPHLHPNCRRELRRLDTRRKGNTHGSGILRT